MLRLGNTTTNCILETYFSHWLCLAFSYDLPLSMEQIVNLVNCTSRSGVGPGLMDGTTKGALQAWKPVGGFKIGKEAGEWTASNFHSYLPLETYLTCRWYYRCYHITKFWYISFAWIAFNSAGLLFLFLRTGGIVLIVLLLVALPGCIGTLDEVFNSTGMDRVRASCSLTLVNYDTIYLKLLGFLDDCKDCVTLSKGEVASMDSLQQ